MMVEADKRPIIGITMGDPAGIGPEVIAKGYNEATTVAIPLVIGDITVLKQAVEVCDVDRTVRPIVDPEEATEEPEMIDVLGLDNVDIDTLEYGVVDADYGRASLDYVERAIELSKEGAIDAITTAPINKQSTRKAGSKYAGHTGMLADYTDTDVYSMMLVEEPLRVTHVSTHVPLREACDIVTTEKVLDTIRVTDEGLSELGVSDPTIAVAGLNPHAGEDRLLGDEDAVEIAPAVKRAHEQGIDVDGPESPDTVYVRAADGEYDCVISMYHDQGHIPIKMLGFSGGQAISGVNVTVGLPIVRTSVDHGTAFDIAGDGIASETSLVEAVEVAAEMATARADDAAEPGSGTEVDA